VALYIVRHAQAGDRKDWDGDDRVRPLTAPGLAQARHLDERFASIPVALVLSSPYVRCMQTVEPLAHSHGLSVEPTKQLKEGKSFAGVLELLETVPDHTVLCSHGDVIPETIAALYRRGMEITSAEDWRKGSTWVIERDGDTFPSALALPPPPKH
jgi:8-oxo-dGTP diphosphatase